MKITGSLFLSLGIVLLGFVPVMGQSKAAGQKPSASNTEVVSTGMAIYWKAMSQEEKNTFLTGYLTSHYEIVKKTESSRASHSKEIRELREELRKTISYLKVSSYEDRQAFIQLIDRFYRRNLHKGSDFEDALAYAYRMLPSQQQSSAAE